MKVLICPDSFKGTFSALEVSLLISQGVTKVDPQAILEIIPLADGGDGTLTTLSSLIKIYQKRVAGPLGINNKKSARFGIIKNETTTALIETSEAIGLHLVPKQKRNPLYTTTYGVGELIKTVLDKNCKKIILAIGGSSTNDAGMGMAQSLGVKFFDDKEKEIHESKENGYCGKSLVELNSIDSSDIDSRIKDCKFLVASDVQNPLYGKNGAAFVYASQKGASAYEVTFLDDGLKNFAKVVKRSLNKDISDLKGGGAAGGLGAGLKVFLDAEILSGIDFIMKAVQFEKYVKQSDVIITGEGCIDSQTAQGKTISGVLSVAKNYNKPVIAIAGCLGSGYKNVQNVSIIEDASKGLKKTLSYFKNNSQLISEATYNAFNKWRKYR